MTRGPLVDLAWNASDVLLPLLTNLDRFAPGGGGWGVGGFRKKIWKVIVQIESTYKLKVLPSLRALLSEN